jgi:hypothetical protein
LFYVNFCDLKLVNERQHHLLHSYRQSQENEVDLLANKPRFGGAEGHTGDDHDKSSQTAVRPSGTYTIFHEKHHIAASRQNEACIE